MKRVFLLILPVWMTLSLSAQSPDNYYVKGMAELLNRNYVNAVISLTEAIARNNSDERYYLNRAEALLHLGKFSEAMEDCEEANIIRPGSGELGIARAAAANGDVAATLKHLENHLRSAFRLPEAILTRDPLLDPVKQTDEWHLLWQQEWYNDFDKVKAEVQYLIRKKTPEMALDYLNPLMPSFKDNAAYYALRAGLYMAEGNYAAAVADYSMALTLDKGDPGFYFGRGLAFLKSEKFRNALDDFNKGLRLEPAQFEYYLERAKACAGLADFKAAIRDAEFYLELFPEEQQAIALCGELHYQDENYIGALKYFNRNLKSDPNNADYYKARGKTYLKTKTFSYAINDLSMALDLKPDDGETYLYLALAKYETGDKTGACSDLRKALHYGNTLALKYSIEYCGQ